MALARSRRPPKPGDVGGRPSEIDLPFDLRQDGTTRTVGDAICDDVRSGLPIDTAIGRAGQKRSTVRAWLEIAGRLTIQETAGTLGQLTPHQTKCRAFAVKIDQARAQYLTNEWERHATAAYGGGRITSVRTKRKFAGRDDTTGIVVERIEEVRTLPPDARAIEWRLAKFDPARFGQSIKVTVEEPVLTEEDIAASLADELEVFLAGAAAGQAEAEEKVE